MFVRNNRWPLGVVALHERLSPSPATCERQAALTVAPEVRETLQEMATEYRHRAEDEERSNHPIRRGRFVDISRL